MRTPLRVLMVEDSDDELLLVRMLKSGGYDLSYERVETMADLAKALTATAWDLIISDHHLTDMTSFDVLRVVRQTQLDVPFVIVSGTIGEEDAVEAMKAGANDYILKGNLTRLLPAVERGLGEAAERKARRQDLEALHHSENRFRALIGNVSDLITVLSADHRILYQSPSSETILGYGPDDLVGKSLFDLVEADDRLVLESQIVAARAQPPSMRRMEIRVKHRDGNQRVLDIMVKSMLDNPTVAGIVVSGRDITEREQLAAQLRQSQKMEAFGQFAGGIAHDFNNLLTVIIGFGEILHYQMPADSPYQEGVQQIRQAGDSAVSLTRQLLAFSRRQFIAPTVLDLKQVVEQFGEILQKVIGEDVNLTVASASDLGAIKADQGQIEQILMNLGTNARDALPKGGDLTISMANVDLDQAYADQHADVKPGPHVRLSVSDNGTGMDAATLARVFEPFFTTKVAGRGTGLGLAAVYGIVTQSGGSIDVASKPGQGTTVSIYFPRVAASLPSPQSRPPPADRPGGNETILVVDDDPRLQKLIRMILEGGGYTVLVANRGEQALSVAAAASEQVIDLLLTDVILPDLSGLKVAARLQAARPGLRVLFMSGYTDDIVVREGIRQAEINFIPKPLTPSSLTKKIREVLDAAGP